jgi:hypothetical protein
MISNDGRLSKATQSRFGLPETFKTIGPFPFEGMDTQGSRIAISDSSCWWQENYIKIGNGNVRTVPDIGPPLYSVGLTDSRTIVSFFWYNIGRTVYCAIFFDDGSAVQVDEAGNVGDIVAPSSATAFYQAGGQIPATVQWGSIYLLISNNNTSNDYWLWDGALLYQAGTLGPIVSLTSGGSGYISAPTVAVFGGHGAGAVLSATISNGSVTSVQVVNPGTGYVVGDIVQAVFTGGGGGTGAELTAVLVGVGVSEVIVLDGGNGYLVAPTVGFAGGGGAGATATANLTGTAVTSVTVTAPGAGYTSAPTVSFTPVAGGTGAAARAVLFPSSVASVTVTAAGSTFFGIPALTFTGGFGVGAAGFAALGGPGPIETITVTDGGSGYAALPTVTITDGGAGTGATAIVTGLVGGVITEITVTAGGQDYTAPVVTFSAGAATATANIGSGSITSVTVSNPGQGYTDAPAVIVQPGLNTAASGMIALMPYGVSGSSIETYQSQVWLQNPFQPGAVPTGGVRLSSAPGSVTDFATSSGGLEETNTDRFLRAHYTAIRQANGFLYPFGDSSVGVISNVQIQGNPPSKTLTSTNTDPQTGTNWRDSVQDFSRTIVFANTFGVYGLFGGAVTKLSGKMDRVFLEADLPTTEDPLAPGQPVTPTSAVANLYNRKIYLLLMSIKDPFTLQHRNAMVCWNEQDWSIISQSADLTYIGTQEVNSQLRAWGTDGSKLYPLMVSPSASLTKTWATKLYGAQQPYIVKGARMVYVQAENFADTSRAPLFTLTLDTEYASFPMASPELAFPPNAPLPASAIAPPVACPVLMATTGDIPGAQIGVTLRSTGADHSVYNLQIATEDNEALFG